MLSAHSANLLLACSLTYQGKRHQPAFHSSAIQNPMHFSDRTNFVSLSVRISSLVCRTMPYLSVRSHAVSAASLIGLGLSPINLGGILVLWPLHLPDRGN